ncbi:hypothetical protein [Crossiella cryophila]|uniref:Uncharacterized protein n=1 Tax=Crossiella cryophila TaxID=43355 RepID=A0A7W7CB80_9PSEU|nr:hypothetical protein [Crossiella cryophila]MBB4676668.1 hypothetical protein [Crossiella cryophila]
MRYEVILAEVAQRTFDSMPSSGQQAFTAKRRRLAVAPEQEGTWSPKTHRWTTHMGPHGVIEYTVHGSVVRVVVWRIQFYG